MKVSRLAPIAVPAASLAAAFGAVLLYLTATSAFGQTAEVYDDARISLIATADVEAVVAPYAPDAVMEWVGGPLDGSYRTAADRRAVWTKFAAAQGPLNVTTTSVSVHENPKGRTVTTNVVFVGSSATLNVHHTQVWRQSQLVSEIWQNEGAAARD